MRRLSHGRKSPRDGMLRSINSAVMMMNWFYIFLNRSVSEKLKEKQVGKIAGVHGGRICDKIKLKTKRRSL